eukprot:TRINITY_DN5307_c0_g1_i3.p1 TRINITY_DN5307_c0_g1~~TRINITY_DN5307_c0_g1_i3.p1  ORF type:complete len:268 (-),score=58.47 TRINITY_DN5307_c0_g1_i3:10-813(-)
MQQSTQLLSKKQIQQFQEQINSLQNQLQELEKSVFSSAEQIKSSQTQFHNFKNLISYNDNKLKVIILQIDEVNKRTLVADQIFKTQTENINQSYSAIMKIQTEKEVKSEITKLEGKLFYYENLVKVMTKELDIFKDKNLQITTEYEKFQIKVENDLKTCQSKYSQSQIKLETERKNYSQQISDDIQSLTINIQKYEQKNLELSDQLSNCLLYTSDAADDMQCVDLGGRRIIKKKKKKYDNYRAMNQDKSDSTFTIKSDIVQDVYSSK